MKRYFLILFLALASFASNAQMHVGVTGGATFSATAMGSSLKIGWYTGAFVFYNFNDNLYMNAGAQYARYHTAGNGTDNGYKYKFTELNQFIEVPIHVGYDFNIINWLDAFVEAGPTVSVGLYGVQSRTYYTSTLDFYVWGDNPIARRVDPLIGLKAGFKVLKHGEIFGGFDYGILNNCINGHANTHSKIIRMGLSIWL
ncbi:MAG: outer membrane beta-barrel protein [Bacteroidales bacterium]|nr:outer membrane beta-barrel protein [Bacteroidales bacterium]